MSQWGALADPRTYVPLLAFGGLLGAGIYAQIYRYRRAATLIERQQIKWVGFGITLYLVSLTLISSPYWLQGGQLDLVAAPWIIVPEVLWGLLPGLLPLVLTVAVMRYRLWAVDVLIHRTLVYGSLTAGVVALYILLVGATGALSQTSGNLLVSLLATGLIAVLFQPLRERLQRGVNRLMYGERDDPYAVISRLGQRLEASLAPEAVLPMIVETVAQALKLPYAAIQLDDAGGPASVDDSPAGVERSRSLVASYGKPQSELIALPLIYQSEPIGRLLLAPRAPGEAFTPADRQLLANIAHQA
jgi:hypothetical protein